LALIITLKGNGKDQMSESLETDLQQKIEGSQTMSPEAAAAKQFGTITSLFELQVLQFIGRNKFESAEDFVIETKDPVTNDELLNYIVERYQSKGFEAKPDRFGMVSFCRPGESLAGFVSFTNRSQVDGTIRVTVSID
jgi:hypothetical protein